MYWPTGLDTKILFLTSFVTHGIKNTPVVYTATSCAVSVPQNFNLLNIKSSLSQ